MCPRHVMCVWNVTLFSNHLHGSCVWNVILSGLRPLIESNLCIFRHFFVCLFVLQYSTSNVARCAGEHFFVVLISFLYSNIALPDICRGYLLNLCVFSLISCNVAPSIEGE